jgi:DNA-binding Lrp family transcriptional regulator
MTAEHRAAIDRMPWRTWQTSSDSALRITATQKALLAVLAESIDVDGYAWIGTKELADRLGMARSSVQDALAGLKKAGIILRVQTTLAAATERNIAGGRYVTLTAIPELARHGLRGRDYRAVVRVRASDGYPSVVEWKAPSWLPQV